jgi:hypothetical protein
MNEKIKDLAKQAGYQEDIFGIGHWDMPECEKFAELIVRECLDNMRNSDGDLYFAIWKTKEDFGVNDERED